MEKDSLIIATKNPAKIERYGHILSKYFRNVIGLSDVADIEKPIETGETAEENAQIKSLYYAQKTGKLVLSEDESLFVDFLPESQQPGVHVRRINHVDDVDDSELLTYWENVIKQVPEGKRTGEWHIAYCFASPKGVLKIFAIDSPIMFFSPSSKVKIPGWPMSSLEGPTSLGKPDSELTAEEKNLHYQELDSIFEKTIKEFLI